MKRRRHDQELRYDEGIDADELQQRFGVPSSAPNETPRLRLSEGQPSTRSACNGPSSRSDRREIAGSSTSPCVNGSLRFLRSRCSAAIGRQSSSTTVLGSPATSSQAAEVVAGRANRA